VRELPAAGSGRRQLLGGGVALPGVGEEVVYGWHVVELPFAGPPRTVWRSADVLDLPAGDEPSVAVDAGGSRWAVLMPRVTAGQLTGGLLLLGELPKPPRR